MDLPAFCLGLGLGLALLAYYRTRSNRRFKLLWQSLHGNSMVPPKTLDFHLEPAIAQQQHQRQQLEQQLATWEHILKQIPLGYLQVDDENQLVWCNPAAAQLLGMKQCPISQPRLLLELVRSYELDELIEQTRQQDRLFRSDWVLHSVSPNPARPQPQLSCALRGHGIPLPEGQVGVFLENRQEIVMLKQQRDRCASDVAHELKTPLTSIRLVAETLQVRMELPLREWVDRLLEEVVRLSDLVQDLLSLSQMEKGAFHSLDLSQVNLSELVQSAWLSLAPLAQQKQLTLNYLGPDAVWLRGDGPRLHRALLNLLDNGIKYSPPTGQITVRLELEGLGPEFADLSPQIHLEVIDEGPGFPEATLDQVFERFFRADVSRSRDFVRPGQAWGSLDSLPGFTPSQGGSGLGLAIVRQIVEAHQGTVRARNHPKTGGAWLEVTLPSQRVTEVGPALGQRA